MEGSLRLDGNSDYLNSSSATDNITFIDYSGFDWTMDLQVKHVDHAGTEYYMTVYEDADNYWALYHEHGAGVKFYAKIGGTEICSLQGGEITDTNWHHIAVCVRSNNTKIGLYVDGDQVAYDTIASGSYTGSPDGTLYIGSSSTPGSYFDGWMDEIYIARDAHLSADPQSNNSDSFTVPAYEYNVGYYTTYMRYNNSYMETRVQNRTRSRQYPLYTQHYGGCIHESRRVTANTGLSETDRVLFCDTDSTAITVSLISGSEGLTFKIINCGSSANDVTIDGYGAETVRGAATLTLSDGEIAELHYDPTEGWW